MSRESVSVCTQTEKFHSTHTLCQSEQAYEQVPSTSKNSCTDKSHDVQLKAKTVTPDNSVQVTGAHKIITSGKENSRYIYKKIKTICAQTEEHLTRFHLERRFKNLKNWQGDLLWLAAEDKLAQQHKSHKEDKSVI